MKNSIPQSFLDELLARSDIVEIIETRVSLRKTGSNYAARCPFHTEKTPSFTVSPTKQFYYCFGCGAHGNAISFLMQFDRMEFIDAVESLASKTGLIIPQQTIQPAKTGLHSDFYSLLEKVNKFYQKELRQSQKTIAYLKARGVTGQIAKRFGIGHAPEGWDNLSRYFNSDIKIIKDLITTGMLIKKDNGNSYDRFRERVMFPIRDTRGRVIAFGGRTLGDDLPKYLNSPETPIFHKSSELYGLYEARQANQKLSQILIVEGYMDVIALAQYDISYAVATLGTAINYKHIQRLLRYSNKLIFCFDGDNAGRQAAWRALEATLSFMNDGLQVFFMFLPEGEDPDTMVRKEGKIAFEKRLTHAMPLSDFFFMHLSESLNLQQIDGKARLKKLAADLLNQIPRGVFQQLMYQKLADLIQMDVSMLEGLASDAKISVSSTKQAIPQTLVIQAITLLLQYPQLAVCAADMSLLIHSHVKGVPILIQMIELLQQNPTMTAGSLLEHWRDKKIAPMLAELASRELFIPQEGLEAEFQGILNRLYELDIEQQIQNLLNKANNDSLTLEEKNRLQKLLANRLLSKP